MRRIAALAAIAVSTAVAAGVTPGRAGAESERDTDEYVVAFDTDVAGLERSVEQAGGTVVDVNEVLGLALVESGQGSDFLTDVRGEEGVEGAARNHSVGTVEPGMPHRFADERPSAAERTALSGATPTTPDTEQAGRAEPLANLQWNMEMIGATSGAAHTTATGEGVDVGIIDTGIDASHPDVAPNVDLSRSRNFTVDIPALDGPCEVVTCIDPVSTDDGGHGTHVAGIVAAARNGLGIAGVAPDATLVNMRAGQDSGYFFLYEVTSALTEAASQQLDVVNMSFYTDPWLYNCAERDDYLSGDVTDEELEQQRVTRRAITSALEYAHSRGVTLVAAAGNEHLDMSSPWRVDAFSPGVPPGSSRPRVVKRTCLDLPNEGPHVISVSSVGPSGTKTDYSNYGQGSIELAAPGGWLRDRARTPHYLSPGNMVLSSYPRHVAVAEQLADPNGNPVDAFSVSDCGPQGTCGFYTYLQGTSMAAPHVVGVAALVVQRHGQGSPETGYHLHPDRVAQILASSARDVACPAGGVQSYAAAGRPSSWDARCDGGPATNSFYGQGIVDAAAAVR